MDQNHLCYLYTTGQSDWRGQHDLGRHGCLCCYRRGRFSNMRRARGTGRTLDDARQRGARPREVRQQCCRKPVRGQSSKAGAPARPHWCSMRGLRSWRQSSTAHLGRVRHCSGSLRCVQRVDGPRVSPASCPPASRPAVGSSDLPWQFSEHGVDWCFGLRSDLGADLGSDLRSRHESIRCRARLSR